MTTVKHDNKTLVKNGNRIIGFVYARGDDWAYAYGKPSQANYIEFVTTSYDVALNSVKKFAIVNHMGSIYRLNDGALEFAPLMNDSSVYSDDDFNPVEPELVGEEVITVEGEDITLYEVFDDITEQLK